MLYLPTITVADIQIRLAASADNIAMLCASFCSDKREEPIAATIFRCPGILIFVASKYCNATRLPIENPVRLIDWTRDSLFNGETESDAFAIADSLPSQLNNSLAKWQEKPTRKRLIKYLSTNSRLDKKNSRLFIEKLFAQQFDFTSLNKLAQFESMSDRNGSCDNSKRSKLNQSFLIQHWQACEKIQQFRRDFSLRLQEQKMLAMKQLAYGASHEINNPLANIATRAQALMLDEKLPSRKQKLAVIYSQSIRAHEMISDLMLFANPPDATFQPVEPLAIVEQVIEELQIDLKDSDVTFQIRQYPDVPLCDMDSTHIAEAIKAIIQNAMLAIGQCGEIRVQLWRRQEDKIAISISDNGPGIDANISQNVFDPFFSGREAGRGLGFGLSKAWRIIEMHGGKITLDEQHQPGSRFVMALPIKQCSNRIESRRIDNVRAA